MSRASFPTLLTSNATILGALTRSDLVALGGAYLALSWMKVSGVYSLIVIAVIYGVLKVTERMLPKGFVKYLSREKNLEWDYKIGGLYE